MQIEDFSLGQCIGKGAFGEVYLTTRIGYNKLYATKKIPKKIADSEKVRKYFHNEIKNFFILIKKSKIINKK